MEEKKYQSFDEEENTGMVCEPPAGYAATGSGYVNTVDDMEENETDIPDDWDPGVGPYTMEEINARIDEAEAAIERAEHGDWSDWVTSEEMDRSLYAKFPWLR